jgi:hypothetical protein
VLAFPLARVGVWPEVFILVFLTTSVIYFLEMNFKLACSLIAAVFANQKFVDLALDPAWDQFLASSNEERTPMSNKELIQASSSYNTN